MSGDNPNQIAIGFLLQAAENILRRPDDERRRQASRLIDEAIARIREIDAAEQGRQ